MDLVQGKPDRSLDIRGNVCPYTLIDTRDTLQEMQNGELLEVLTDWEPAVRETIPNYCRSQNYAYDVAVQSDGTWRILIQKGD